MEHIRKFYQTHGEAVVASGFTALAISKDFATCLFFAIATSISIFLLSKFN